jgi:predicted permease
LPKIYATVPGTFERNEERGMTSITDALFPVLGLILAGFVIQRTAFLPPTFWPSAEKLTYFLLMPATLIHNLAGKEIGSLPWVKILLTVEGAVLASSLLVTLWWLVNRKMGGPAFTSLFQGGVRFNTFVALALAENLFGKEGLFLAAMGAGFMIILINVLCVSAFSLAVSSGKVVDPKRLLIDLLRNPLIIGCVVGVGLNASGLKLPLAIDGVLALGGKAAFPLGLMAVGAAYRAENLMLHWQPLLVTSTVQFIFKPLIAWGLASYLGLTGIALNVAVLLFSVPTAPSAYILSRQMGGDHDSMAAIITAQTCLSFITLPLTVWLLRF